ncbi:MAG: putative LPS assembly protein LptD [Paludibacter sp.]|nr:putative LPS assembly protein LptD [Paludibacter sp.]
MIICLWLILPVLSIGQQANPLTDVTESVLMDETLIQNNSDSTQKAVPTKFKSNQIDSEINYSAKDSIVFFANGTGFLYGETDIKYKKINLKADYIRVKMDSSVIYARGTADSLGVKKGEPIFSENEKEYSSKELSYNLKTKKAYIRQAVTQEGEGYIISDKTKKTADNVFCIADGKYTTCDNHDHPHFYLSISKGKVKPDSYIVTGPAHLVIADVPLPIVLPFGFFPFTNKYSSGLLMPSYTDEMTRGFGLTNGGWYFAVSDYLDLEVKGDVYTKGTWALRTSTNYVKRYKFRGSLGVEYREDVTGEIDLPNYNKRKNFSVQWSHSQDQKASPNFTFSSSVNFSTSGYNRSNINSYSRPELNSENTKYSSINFTKRFPEIPSLNISGGMSITQRTKDSTISLSLPNVNISYSRFYPLKRKNAVGQERWYEKISMSYSGSLTNSIDTKESLILRSSLQRDWRNSMRHSIPVSATFNVLKYINISPSFSYNERWALQSVDKSWDKAAQKEIIDTISGFNRVYDFNMGVSASTKLYGFFIPIRSIFGDKVDRIRHVLTPSIGFGYTPDFGDEKWGMYDTYIKSVRDVSNPEIYRDTEVKYAHSMYGAPNRGKSGNLNFSVSNNVEMKLRNDKDTTGTNPFTKVSLIDNLSVSGSYNIAADSMQWSNFSTSIRIKITQNYSINLSTSFDPYMYGLSPSGYPVRINKLRWNNGMFPRFTGTSTQYSYTLNNDTFKKLFQLKDKSKNKSKDNSQNQPERQESGSGIDDNFPESQLPGAGGKNKQTEMGSDGYEKISIPWSISANYSVSYGNTVFNKNKMEYDMGFTHNLSFNGSLTLTQKWNITANSTYDFKSKQISYFGVNVNRNLHCWNMSASIVPFGTYKSYSFHLGVNASMLSDLKYDKQSGYKQDNINWY